jgi:streptomycin 6-kinase
MNEFKKNVISIWGTQGQEWLNSLDHLVELCTQKWQLTDIYPMPDFTYNYVATASRGDALVVLKLGFDKRAITQEMHALSAFAGSGCVRLLDYDIANGALLLEQAIPGYPLRDLFPDEDEQAVTIAAQVIKRLHSQPVDDTIPFDSLETWLKPLSMVEKRKEIEPYITKALEISYALLAESKKRVLLHGDLHHRNIVASEREEWLAIDPKGVMGDPAFEVGTLIYNPMPTLMSSKEPEIMMNRRIKQYANLLDIDEARIRQWAYVKAVLSACWALEDGTMWEQFTHAAKLLEPK